MINNKNSKEEKLYVKDFLLEEYRHFSKSLWNNEQTGEMRVNLFIGIVSLAVIALATLLSGKIKLSEIQTTLVVKGSLYALIVIGLITLLRILTRNEHTDECKRSLNTIGQVFKDKFDKDATLVQYYPIKKHSITSLEKKGNDIKFWCNKKNNNFCLRKFGGLAHTVAAINSLLIAGLVELYIYQSAEKSLLYPLKQYFFVSPIIVLPLSFGMQLLYVEFREKQAKKMISKGDPTHAVGVVYKNEKGIIHYLLTKPKDHSNEWLFPKGHIELREGHIEAAIREVQEETGVIARFICFIDYAILKIKNELVYAKFYLLEYLYEGSSSESREKEWFPFNDALKELTFVESKYILHEAEKIRISLGKEIKNKSFGPDYC